MSISSMAEVAYVRRADVELPVPPAAGGVSKPFDKIELVTSGTPEAQTTLSTALKVIVTYIPTEVVTLYVAVLAAIGVPNLRNLQITFYSFLVATPIVVWLVYAAKCKGGGKDLPLAPRTWPVWEMSAATIAYTAWAAALPQNPFTSWSWYSSGLAAILILVVSTFLGLLAPLFQRPIPA